MHSSPTIRLTLWYVLIIMLLSLSFSVAIDQVVARQARIGLRRQAIIFRERRPPMPLLFDPVDDELLRAQVGEIQARLRVTLAIINGIILATAGSASYFLARRTLRPIEENLDAQRRFTADASHELRTPLTAMKSEIEVMLRDTAQEASEYRRVLRSALEEIQRLEQLSHGLLRLARHEEQRNAATSMSLLTTERIVAEARQSVQAEVDRKQMALVVSKAEGAIIGDHDSLLELLVILLDNAVKYSPPHTTVKIRAEVVDARVRVTVRDHGMGIKASDLPHIFDRFYRADASRSKTKVSGYGLGLSIAKQIVERHRGSIEVQSEPDQGTTVTVILPRAKD